MKNKINTASSSSIKKNLLLHSIFWLLYFLFAWLNYKYSNGFGTTVSFITVVLIDAITIYFLYLYFIPKSLEVKGKNTIFLFYFSQIILINFLLNFVVQNFLIGTFEYCLNSCIIKQYYSLHHSLVFIMIASGIKVYQYNIFSTQKIAKLETEKMQSELEHLKLQMNPHFLFNSLNNIYIQTRVNPKQAAETLLKLSDLLRYQIYECSDSKVFLKSEIEYIKNYLDIQKVRFTKLEVKIEQTGNITGLMVYPFLFIPFVENSIKHGVEASSNNNYIDIKFIIINKKLEFIIESSKINTKLQQNNKKEGSLKKIKNKLDNLYSNNYKLEIEDRENYYYVKLEINLEK